MPCTTEDVRTLLVQLEEVAADERAARWTRYDVAGQTFAYVWPATSTVGLKQLLSDQLGLIAERPEVFESQFVAGRFGWVVCRLAGVERDELAELVFEAWRLAAPEELVTSRADRLPR